MSTENTQTPAAGGDSAASTASNAATEAINTPAASTSVETPPATVTTPAAPSVPGAPGVPQTTAAVIPAAYVPNFKYKAALQEKELDPFFQGLVKDADSEKKVKDVFTRADAFDYMKEKFSKREQDFNSLQNDFQNQSQIFQKVNQAKAKGDLDSVFRIAGLNEHQVIQWAAKRVDYLQMLQGLPPDQRQALERQQQAVFQNQEYEDRLSQMQQQVQTNASQAREMQLDMSLTRPEVASAVKFWDQKMGYEGAFRDMVIEEAQKEWHFAQKDLSPEQAVAHVLQKFGKFIDAQGAGPQSQVATLQPAAGPQAPAQRPSIPVIAGSSKAPIKKQYKSIDELKQRSKELEAQGG